MEDVERALQIQYSLRPKFTYADYQLESVVDNLEKIVSAIIEHRTKHIAEELPDKPQPVPMEQIEDAAIKLGQMIEDLTQPTQKVEPSTKPINKPVQVQQTQVKTEFNSNVDKQIENFDKHVEDKITEYDEHTEELTNRLDGKISSSY